MGMGFFFWGDENVLKWTVVMLVPLWYAPSLNCPLEMGGLYIQFGDFIS